MTNLTLRQLQYFLAAVDHGSVTAAAEASYISQAAASMALAHLERSVGADLLIHQRSKGVTPTPAGRILAQHARRVLGEVADLETAVTGSRDEMRGDLRIGCAGSLTSRVIPPLVEHFVATHPEVELTYREGSADELQQTVQDGGLDLAFLYSLQLVDGVSATRITQVHQHLMLAETHPLAHREALSLRDVAEEPAILFDAPPSLERLKAIIRSAGVEPRVKWSGPTMETIRALVARGLGYSIINSIPAVGRSHGDGVVYIPISDELPKNSLVAVQAHGVRPTRRVSGAMDFTFAYFAEGARRA